MSETVYTKWLTLPGDPLTGRACVTPPSVHSSPQPLLAPARTPDVCPEIIHSPKVARNCSYLRAYAIALWLLKLTRPALPAPAARQTTTSRLFWTIEHP